jgi:hypothetical protein
MTSRWTHLLVRYTSSLIATLIFAACASTQTTPQQDYTYEMGKSCETPTTKIERVAPDGRYWIQARGDAGLASTEYPKFFACMKDQFKAHPFFDWAKAQKRDATLSPIAVGSTNAITSASSGRIMAPIWQVGDEWQYAYKSPSDSGTFVWFVERIGSIDGIPHYVIKTGTREIFYRVSDLASSLERVDGVVVRRETPSRLVYTWPLTVGKSWEQSTQDERPVDRQTTSRNNLWTVEAEEPVTVLAGTFRALRITWRNKNTGALLYEMWYAPDVKQMVKIREILSSGQRERELISFKLK